MKKGVSEMCDGCKCSNCNFFSEVKENASLSFKLIFAILLLSLAAGCVTQSSRPAVTTQPSAVPLEDMLDRMNRFQGQGAWQKYSVLSLRRESGALAVFETAVNELKLTITTAAGDKKHHFFIPGVVYMNKGIDKKYAYSTDLLEMMGLNGQLYLYVLEKAFPEGPDGIVANKTKVIHESQNITLKFLSGGVLKQAPWRAEVTASRKSAHQVEFTIDLVNDPQKAPDDHSVTQGVWSNESRGKVLADSTPLSEWAVNYLRIGTWEKDKRVSSNPVIGDTSSFKTVGDIRKASGPR